MILVLVSDTHELESEIDLPYGDLLIHAGDFTMFSRRVSAIEEFNLWLEDLPHPVKLVGAGNHEFFLEADPRRKSLLTSATVLIDEGVEVDGLKIWFSPVTPLYGGGFGMSSPRDRARHWAKIPVDTNVLVTHGPPFGILDRSPGSSEHMGDPELLDKIQRLPALRLHVFGHVHGGYGMTTIDNVTFVNAALLGSSGELEHEPIVLRIEPEDAGREE